MMGPLHPKNQKIRDAHPYQSDLGVETAISGVPSGDSNAMAAVQHKNQPQDHQDLAMSTSSSDDPIATPTSSTEFDSTANLGSSVSGMKAGVGDAPSDSHAMAASDEHDHLGIAHQEYEGVGVQDLGWQPETDHIHNPLIAKMPNEDLWMLIRRFNQQMYDVKATTKAAPGGLDLVVADEEAFSPDKLTANLERFYVEIGLGMMGFAKQIVRLRSWREKRRTIGFAGVSGCCPSSPVGIRR